MSLKVSSSLDIGNNSFNKNDKQLLVKKENKVKSNDGYYNSLKGHQLSPLSFGTKVEKIDLQKIGNKDRKSIQEVLDNCRYTRLPVILNPENIKIQQNKHSFIIEGFDTPDDKHINGVCYELALKVANKLEDKMKGKILIAATNGRCAAYNMNHMFLIAFKDTPENRKKYETITANCQKISDEIMPFMADLHNPEKFSDPAFIEKMQELSTKMQDLTHKPADFKNAVIIDPSFGTIINPDKTGDFEGYQLCGMYKAENVFKKTEFPIDEDSGKMNSMPLGYIKDIAPEIKDKYPDTALLFMSLEKCSDSKPGNIIFSVSEDEQTLSPRKIDDFEEQLPKGHCLRSFADKIRSEINKK